MRKARTSAWLALAALCVSGANAGEVVKGRVVDIGLPDGSNGIGGVAIVVTDVATQLTVGDGVTDATGLYQIEVSAPARNKLVAAFSKIGYFARPTYQPVTRLAQSQPSARLSRESAPETYYKAAADNIWNFYKADPSALPGSYSAITALPTGQKEVVLNWLKLRDDNAYKNLKEADQTYVATQEFLGKYRPTGGSARPVTAYANYGSAGTVWLYGSVPTVESKRDFEKAIKGFTAVQSVQNDLFVPK
jgi:hypothetical protein